jgi:hypothetical protein
MPRNNTDPRVDAYIGALPEWQQAICHQAGREDQRAGPHDHVQTDYRE